jgi:hypothetical protein
MATVLLKNNRDETIIGDYRFASAVEVDGDFIVNTYTTAIDANPAYHWVVKDQSGVEWGVPIHRLTA